MSTYAKLNLDVAIGQMLIVGFDGKAIEADSAIVRDIKKFHLGGTVLFDEDLGLGKLEKNIQNPSQLAKLIQSLKNACPTPDLPFLIAIDEEGGKISRLKPEYGFDETVSNQFLGDRDSEQATRIHRQKIAKKLSKAGINLNLAPVIDLNLNPENPAIGFKERSFSEDPKTVIRHSIWTIEELHKYKILSCLKHFPGQGSAKEDTHLGIVDVTESYQEQELLPFQALIDQNLADSIMAAHIYNANLDEIYPASLSYKTITSVLRERLNFTGVIISDCLQMGAISKHYSLEERIKLTINAGIDILLFSNNSINNESLTEKIVKIIKNLVKKGEVTEKRIFQSYSRIKQFKNKFEED